jgi:hypothetical protein
MRSKTLPKLDHDLCKYTQTNLDSVAESDMQADRPTQPITDKTNQTNFNDFHQSLSVSDLGSSDSIKKLPTVKERLLHAEGGYYLSGEAAKLLGITEQKLEELRQTDKIIGLPVKDGRHVYPKWQIVKHWFWGYQIVSGLADVLAAFPSKSPWMWAGFMLNDSYCDEFPTPLAGLKAGKIAQVVVLSQHFGEHGAA